MECAVCNTRSSVGYCAECQKLLCEECGITCEQCGSIVCDEHMHETRSGRTLCLSCNRKRHEERAKEKGERAPTPARGTGYKELQEDVEVQDEALTASARRVTPPWKMSLYISIAAVVVMLLIIYFDTLRGAGIVPLVLLIIPLWAVVWAIIAIRGESLITEKLWALGSIAIAAVAVVLAFYAFYTDPVRAAQREAAMQEDEVQGLTQEQRMERVRQMLQQRQ